MRVSGSPSSTSSRRVALARSADNSQLVRSGPGNGAASVWPAIEIGWLSFISTGTIFCISSLTRSFGVAEPEGNIGSLTSSMIWMRRPSGVMSIANCLARSASAGSLPTASLICCAACSNAAFCCFSRCAAISASVGTRLPCVAPSRCTAAAPPGPGAGRVAAWPSGLSSSSSSAS